MLCAFAIFQQNHLQRKNPFCSRPEDPPHDFGSACGP
uniref:Unplaced genomic scaffold supercont1.9, whole genome shotgun sequence n=1 Tax=Cryptococcus bacillisporus CA1280 TaxID=1296109 RepID=A0A0D0VPX5_CRYGA|nr:hypothetical protein I312_03583 [Cryptococcus bacillisporus CA1280]